MNLSRSQPTPWDAQPWKPLPLPAAPQEGGPPRRRVLIVDDDPLVRGMLARLVTGYLPDCEVHVAEDGMVAKEKIPSVRPALILLDLVMPRMDGAALCQWLKSGEFADTRVLLFTGSPSSTLLERALAAGAEAWLPKPTGMRTLLCRIRELLDSLSYVGQSQWFASSRTREAMR
jgi:CheY-like chemotaxis protein